MYEITTHFRPTTSKTQITLRITVKGLHKNCPVVSTDMGFRISDMVIGNDGVRRLTKTQVNRCRAAAQKICENYSLELSARRKGGEAHPMSIDGWWWNREEAAEEEDPYFNLPPAMPPQEMLQEFLQDIGEAPQPAGNLYWNQAVLQHYNLPGEEDDNL